MASRCFNNETLTLERQVVALYAEVAIGASGAATLTRGKGVASVAKSATGKYRFTLQDKFARLLAVSGVVEKSTVAGLTLELVAEDVASGKTIDIATVDHTTPAYTEPASGTVIWAKFELTNAS